MNRVIELSEKSFETEVLQADVAVVVDFYAPWCGPCKMLAPLLEQLASEFQGRLKFAKINVDDTANLATKFNITGVPTLACFKEGKWVDAMVGLAAPAGVKSWLERQARKSPSVMVAS